MSFVTTGRGSLGAVVDLAIAGAAACSLDRDNGGEHTRASALVTPPDTVGTWSLRADLGDLVDHVVNVSLR
jgi:hypothetical protein